MATVTAMRKPKITVGSLIDSMSDLRSKKRALEAEVKTINGQMDALEAQLLDLMDSEGISKSTGKLCTASVSESRQFNNDDWDTFVAFMAKTKQFHLIQRRISAPAVRELWDKKGAVPGLSQYTKREISLRDL
jgi:hypothetical protein